MPPTSPVVWEICYLQKPFVLCPCFNKLKLPCKEKNVLYAYSEALSNLLKILILKKNVLKKILILNIAFSNLKTYVLKIKL